MSAQQRLIARLRSQCAADETLLAAMLYGAHTRGEGDRWSDVDVALFFREACIAEIAPRAWVEPLGPVALFYRNEWGNYVAIFDDLLRAEFHFDPASAMEQLHSWKGNAWFPSAEAAILLDRTGALALHLQPLIGEPPHGSAEEIAWLRDSFLNGMLFGSNVLQRGEAARAWELLTLLSDYLLRMARLLEGRCAHRATPTRALERELSPAAYRRYQHCTAPADPAALRAAYRHAWSWGNEMLHTLAASHPLVLPIPLMEQLATRFR